MNSTTAISPTTRRLGLVSHVLFWAFGAEWIGAFTGSATHYVVLGLFIAWVVLRTVWYRRMSAEGAMGVSWSEAIAAYVFAGCLVALMLIPLGVPLGAVAGGLKAGCGVTAVYVLGRGVARAVQEAGDESAG